MEGQVARARTREGGTSIAFSEAELVCQNYLKLNRKAAGLPARAGPQAASFKLPVPGVSRTATVALPAALAESHIRAVHGSIRIVGVVFPRSLPGRLWTVASRL